ncbi:MAG: glycogen synthase GlgA [Candidatus Borkfalkiaceae bacterium]|nr:glycogen synthase GlgA [Christensenellaceae bacterium]
MAQDMNEKNVRKKNSPKTVKSTPEKSNFELKERKEAAEPQKKAVSTPKTVRQKKDPATKTVSAPKKNPASAEKKETVLPEVKISFRPSVLFAASEANPFAGTGGLADVIGSLPKALAQNGNFDIRVVIPLYGDVDPSFRSAFRFEGNFNVPVAWRNQYCGLFSYKKDGVTFYFIDNEYYFKRKGLYGFFDDGERFAFFSRAVLEMMNYLGYYPELLHCHDWQTALTVIYLKTIYAGRQGFDRVKALFTIHNIEYQGKYGHELLQELFGLPSYCSSIVDYDGCINLMKGAMEVAERFSTVSPTYASEIKNPFFAHGLEYMTSRNEYKLCGILNGIDESVYNPATDPKLFANYSADDLSGKAVCKRELQKMLALPQKDDVPVVAVISRLVPAKGLDLIKCVFEDLLSENVQVVILGKGENEYEDYFRYIAERYSGKCRAIIAYNKDLASKLYSGADIFLMPSKQEPCGLSQMIAARYGAIPVVRETGGLADSILPHNAGDRTGGIGFTFKNYNAHEMLYVMKDAIYSYGNKEEWIPLMRRAMTTDFSWHKSAGSYENLYRSMLG